MLDPDDKSAVLADELIGWFNLELPYKDWLKEQYLKWDDDGIRATLNADFDALYRKYFDIDYNHVLEKEPDSFYETGLMILLAWQELIKEDKREEFAEEINHKLKYFDAPLRLTPKGRFHEVMHDTVEYEDAPAYKGGPSRELLIVLLVFLVFLFFFLGMVVFASDPFVAPWDKIP